MTVDESCYFVQIKFPRFAPAGAVGRWVTPAISADRATAVRYAAAVYRRTVSPTGELPEQVRVVSEEELGEQGGHLAVRQAYADLQWFVEREAENPPPRALGETRRRTG